MKLFLLAALLLAAACTKTPCPGFEKVDTGSGCRDISTGEFAPAEKCVC